MSSKHRQHGVQQLQSVQLPLPAKLRPAVLGISDCARIEQCRTAVASVSAALDHAGQRLHVLPGPIIQRADCWVWYRAGQHLERQQLHQRHQQGNHEPCRRGPAQHEQQLVHAKQHRDKSRWLHCYQHGPFTGCALRRRFLQLTTDADAEAPSLLYAGAGAEPTTQRQRQSRAAEHEPWTAITSNSRGLSLTEGANHLQPATAALGESCSATLQLQFRDSSPSVENPRHDSGDVSAIYRLRPSSARKCGGVPKQP